MKKTIILATVLLGIIGSFNHTIVNPPTDNTPQLLNHGSEY